MTRLRRQYHVLHAQHTHPQSLAACLAARVFGKPSVLTLHGRVPTPRGLARRTVHRLSEILTLKLSTEVVAVGAYPSEACSGYPPQRKLNNNAAASLPGYLSAADVFVLPSLYEGMSLGLLEALSSGLPALVSDIPVNRMIVEQTGCGWTFRSGESEDLAQAMHKIVVDGVPENFSKRAREVILQSYNLDEEARRYFALYEQLLA